ncbi:PREDICTED: uncharacterized protein LOC104818247 [Tarenaya hassleriana]|uniref:uncharacterized protein LOC104818247 n=1 Tax=Tarenaya hassleriana TaxID=28532 RepID=UPI00053C86A1|nr:PREDICTED: uncharacterized protein LOC104818247 [Tarenaya hassleriana]
MVAISMYRGNLHKVSDVPRRWRMPERKLSIKEFRSLLHLRKRALIRLFPESDPNLNPKSDSVTEKETENPETVDGKEIDVNRVKEDGDKRDEVGGVGAGGSDGGACYGKDTEVQVKEEAEDVVREEGNSSVVEKPVDAANEKAEVKAATDVLNETGKRRKEIEEKLQVLNAKKHNLVQVLKQILNAEEELKRRNNMQQGVTASRPSLPLQVDVSNGSGANTGGHTERGETEEAVTPNVQSRNTLRFSGVSPSSESPLRRATFSRHNMVPHPSRASPRIGPAQPGNPPPVVSVSASGTNYIASSPSPAASGGTSVFRDSRLQSPWN